MLNEKNERELAYVVAIDEIQSIPNYDRVELATVGGWHIIVQKGQFKVGDKAVYIEVDSRVPIKEPFLFLEKRNYKVKTLKMCKCISQGLLMSFSDFGWEEDTHKVGDFLTKELGITYAEAGDNDRKAPSANKYDKMKQRHKKLFKNPIVKKIMKFKIGREIMFFFFGKKRDKKSAWPSHIAEKTDVERIQNMISILQNKQPFVATEKIDGCSCSIMCEKKSSHKIKQYICSRNVVFENPNQKCYYDTNVYYEVYNKYNLGEKIVQILKDYNFPNIALQLEIYGGNIQKRDYSTKEHHIAIFHIVINGVKLPMEEVVEICEKYNLPHVPILDTNYILPDTIEELQTYVESEMSQIDNLPKEGIVFYDKTGQNYFKFVSPNFLMKYHN